MAAAREAAAAGSAPTGQDAHELTDVVTRLRRALRASIRSDYSWEQLPMAQVEILQVLADASPQRVGDIAARQHLHASTVSGLVGQLMNAGLVDRSVDTADRRASVVTLTAAGKRQMDAWMQAHERRMHHALDHLTEDERARLHAALPSLGRLADLLGSQEPDPAS